eukprot:Sspe_Gene.52808::Locus_29239_Transcript_1_1_Confidence_1.000_Length_1158::g.52808::m.52808
MSGKGYQLVKSLRTKREEQRREGLQADVRSAATADLCIRFGEAGVIRIRTLQGMRELFLSQKGLTPDSRCAMADILRDPPLAPSLDYSKVEGCRQLRELRRELEADWKVDRDRLAQRILNIQKQQGEKLQALAEVSTVRSVPPGMVDGLEKWCEEAEAERRLLQRMQADRDAALERVLTRLNDLPVIDLVQRDNAEVRAMIDVLLGKDDLSVYRDHRPLAQVFPEVTIAQMYRKMISLEVEENVAEHRTRRIQTEPKYTVPKKTVPSRLTEAEMAKVRRSVANRLRQTRRQSAKAKTAPLSAAERYLHNQRQNIAGKAKLSITLPDPADPSKTREFVYDEIFAREMP